jgi:hypothetical protein
LQDLEVVALERLRLKVLAVEGEACQAGPAMTSPLHAAEVSY